MRGATILHIPHSATIIPDEHRHKILLSDDVLQMELLRMTDWSLLSIRDSKNVEGKDE